MGFIAFCRFQPVGFLYQVLQKISPIFIYKLPKTKTVHRGMTYGFKNSPCFFRIYFYEGQHAETAGIQLHSHKKLLCSKSKVTFRLLNRDRRSSAQFPGNFIG